MNAIPSRCPKCEYAKRGAGKAVDLGEGLWHCEQCDSTWREIVGVPIIAKKPAMAAAPEEPADFSDTLAALRRKSSAEPVRKSSARLKFDSGDGFKFAAAAAMVVAGWLGMAALGTPWQIDNLAFWKKHEALELFVTGADRIEDARDGAVQVRGRITNHSRERQNIEALEVVLRDAGGNEMGSWRFLPALRQLEPGQTIRFTSAKGGVPALAQGVEIRFAKGVQRIALGTIAHANRPRQENRGSVQSRTDRPEES